MSAAVQSSPPNQPPYQISPSVVDKLGLDLNVETSVDRNKFISPFKELIPGKFILRQAVDEVIVQVNKALQSSKSIVDLVVGSPWRKRAANWEKSDSNLYWYDQCCGLPPSQSHLYPINTWLNRILLALKDKKHIKQFQINPNGYTIKV